MSITRKVIRYETRNAVRSRWLLGYCAFFLVATEGLLRFGSEPTAVLVSLANVVFLVIPLMTIVFGTMYAYDSREFIELLLAQPVGRRPLFAGLYLGLAVPMSAGFAAGVGLPFLIRGDHNAAGPLLALMLAGVGLTFAFTGLAFLIALRWDDRARGLGVAVGVWIVAGLLYDGAVLMVATMFADYPLERFMIVLVLMNPIDLARVALLLHFDLAALMGYTGAVFKQFFGSGAGMALAAVALSCWIATPFLVGARAFSRKNF